MNSRPSRSRGAHSPSPWTARSAALTIVVWLLGGSGNMGLAWGGPAQGDAAGGGAAAGGAAEGGAAEGGAPALRGGPVSGGGSWRQLYHQVSPSIVLISDGEVEGTGFLFHSSQHIATAFHVVNHPGPLWVTTADGTRLRAEVVAWDEEWDLAILKLPEPLDAPVLEAVAAGAGQVGDRVAAIGNPWGEEQRKQHGSKLPVWALSQGVISAPPADYVQTDAPVNPGNSGGPLLTTDGAVVGVVVVRIAEADGISFATAVGRLAALSKRIGQQGTFAHEVNRWHFQLSWVPVAEHQLSGVLVGGRFAFGAHTGLALRVARLWGDTELASSFSLTQRNRWLAEAELSLFLGNDETGGLLLGAGVATQSDNIVDQVATIEGTELVELRTRRSETKPRLLLSAGIAGGPVLVDAAVYLLSGDAGARLGLGVWF